jgi:hypothetical protein
MHAEWRPQPVCARGVSAKAEFHEDDSGKESDGITYSPKHPFGVETDAQIPDKDVGVEQHLADY